VVDAMAHFAQIAAQGHVALLNGNSAQLHELIDENFDTRSTISQLPAWQSQMVEVARSCGASAKFAGSGGAIVGLYEDEAMFEVLSSQMAEIGSRMIRPAM